MKTREFSISFLDLLQVRINGDIQGGVIVLVLHAFRPLRRKALEMTETELRLIARAAIIGDSSQPVNGKSTP
ncbi:MAG: hypothetical protein ACKVOO_04050, partial [Burkholderiaceae bacterium]